MRSVGQRSVVVATATARSILTVVIAAAVAGPIVVLVVVTTPTARSIVVPVLGTVVAIIVAVPIGTVVDRVLTRTVAAARVVAAVVGDRPVGCLGAGSGGGVAHPHPLTHSPVLEFDIHLDSSIARPEVEVELEARRLFDFDVPASCGNGRDQGEGGAVDSGS